MTATDLYATLDVPRDAPPEVIRRAYRRAAKQAHPDTGGSADKFADLGRALKVLMDPRLRDHYDRTGKIEDVPAGSPEGRAMEFAFSSLSAVIGSCNQHQVDPARVDIVVEAIDAVRKKIAENNQKASTAKKEIDAAKRLGKRLKARRGKVPLLVTMWASNVANMEAGMVKLTVDNPALERAIEILKDHRFEKEEAPVPDWSTTPMYLKMMGGAGTGSTF